MNNLFNLAACCISILVTFTCVAEDSSNRVENVKFTQYQRSLKREAGCFLIGHKKVLHLDLDDRNTSTNLLSKTDDDCRRVMALLATKGDCRIKRILLAGKLSVIQYETVVRKEEDICEELMKSGEFLYVEPNYIISASAIPNDPFYALHQWHHPKINSPSA